MAVPIEAVDDRFVPRPAPGVDTITFDEDGEALLVDGSGTHLHRLNPTGALVWSCFDGTGTVGEIVADLADILGVDADVVRGDVLGLVRDLGSKRLLDGIAVPDTDEDDPNADDALADPRFLGEPPSH